MDGRASAERAGAPGRVQVKICGCRRLADVETAVEAGADYVGFVFARSRRQLPVGAAADIARSVRGSVRLVGVFVDAPAAEVRSVVHRVGLEAVQLHGREPPEACDTVREEFVEVWKALRPTSPEELRSGVERYREVADALLVEGFSEEAAGGTGTAFPHAWLEDWRSWISPEEGAVPRIVLAGGLEPGTVAEAVRRVRPDAVDVSSGVEGSSGHKDPAKVRRFVALARGGHLSLLRRSDPPVDA